MSKGNRTTIAVLGGVLVLAVLVAVSGQTRKQVQVVEMDGMRQTEYKAFGLIPWPVVREAVPNLKVSAESIAELNRAVVSPKSIDFSKAGFVTKIRRGHQVEYCTRMDFKGDAAQVMTFYEKQLKVDISSLKGTDKLLVGKAPDGSQVMVAVSSYYGRKGGPPLGQDFMLKVTRD